jgi:hypothetical protein
VSESYFADREKQFNNERTEMPTTTTPTAVDIGSMAAVIGDWSFPECVRILTVAALLFGLGR